MTDIIDKISADDIRNVFGQFDIFARKIEKGFNTELTVRNGEIQINGDEAGVKMTKNVLTGLLRISEKGEPVEEQNVDYIMTLEKENALERFESMGDSDIICHTVQGKPVKVKTLGQKAYIDAIRDKMIVFGIGPAGTGKTYLAMAMAISAFKNEEVSRIILTRPAIEAGERLGFLPGDLQSKVDPYLRPLYDALYQIMGAESFQKNMEKGLIEVAPLAYMRGRTLDNAYIILDEAQNTTPSQMKMFLTRIGFGSKVVITGDKTQKDLSEGAVSGLDVAEKVLRRIEDIGFIYLDSRDVVRHPLVQRIVKAYEDFEGKKAGKDTKRRDGFDKRRNRK